MNSLTQDPPIHHQGNYIPGYAKSCISKSCISPIEIAPYPLGERGWYQVSCPHTGKAFGGRYSRGEAAMIRSITSRWGDPISPPAFGWAAQQAIATVQGVAA